jgi:hypothetical protein
VLAVNRFVAALANGFLRGPGDDRHSSTGRHAAGLSHVTVPEPLESGSVGVIVLFGLVAGMVVVMVPMITGVVMVVHVGGATVGVGVHVLMKMLVGMGMGMLVAVGLALVGMRMAVSVGVFMTMQMLVLVFAFHGDPPFAVPNPLGQWGPS